MFINNITVLLKKIKRNRRLTTMLKMLLMFAGARGDGERQHGWIAVQDLSGVGVSEPNRGGAVRQRQDTHAPHSRRGGGDAGAGCDHTLALHLAQGHPRVSGELTFCTGTYVADLWMAVACFVRLSWYGNSIYTGDTIFSTSSLGGCHFGVEMSVDADCCQVSTTVLTYFYSNVDIDA